MRRVLMLCMCLVLSGEALALVESNSSEQTQVRISCDALMQTLQNFIRIRTDMEVSYDEHNCMSSSLLQTFVRETSALLSISELTHKTMAGTDVKGLSLVVKDNDPGLTNMLVLALIGRHYTAQFKTGQVFFEFDPITQITTANMPRCEYQRSFFVMLLFVSIVLMIFSLVMQNFSTMPKVQPPVREVSGKEDIIATSNSDPIIPTASFTAKMNTKGFAMNFANTRRTGYSVLPTSCGRQRLVVDALA